MQGQISTTLALLTFRVGLSVPELRAEPPGLFVYTLGPFAVYIGEAERLRARYEDERGAWWQRADLAFHWLILESPALRQRLVRHLVGQFNPPGNVVDRTGPMPDALKPFYGETAPTPSLPPRRAAAI